MPKTYTTFEELQKAQERANSAPQRAAGYQARRTATHKSKKRIAEEEHKTGQERVREQNRVAAFAARQQARADTATQARQARETSNANRRYQQQMEQQEGGQRKVAGSALGQVSTGIGNLGSGLLHAGPDPRNWSGKQKVTAVIGGIFGLILLYIMLTPSSNNSNGQVRGVALVDGIYGVTNALVSGQPMFQRLPDPNTSDENASDTFLTNIGTALAGLP
jgi:hypothetical protein